jgi:hypothetical protein
VAVSSCGSSLPPTLLLLPPLTPLALLVLLLRVKELQREFRERRLGEADWVVCVMGKGQGGQERKGRRTFLEGKIWEAVNP